MVGARLRPRAISPWCWTASRSKASGKPQHRPLELLKALVALGGREVHGEALDRSAVAGRLGARRAKDPADHDTAVARAARQRRDAAGAGRQADPGRQSLLGGCLGAGAVAEPGQGCAGTWRLGRRWPARAGRGAAALPGSLFFAGEPDQPWLVGRRERLRERLLRALDSAGQHLERARRFTDAQALYEQAVDIEPLAEELYRRLMVCLSAQGQRAEAMEVYRRCRRHLSVVLGISPAAATEALYRSLASGK
jgi:tetratricopeptide (TPR) repeat protein